MKNSQKMAYIMNTLYIERISEQIAKTAKAISFSDDISLYSESAAWLPDSCLDRDKTDRNR